MSALPSQPEALDELLIALVDGELTPETFARLGSRLSEDPAAQVYYRRYMRLCALLEFELANVRGEGVTRPANVATAAQAGAAIESPPPPVVSALSLDPSTYFSGCPLVCRSAAHLCLCSDRSLPRDAGRPDLGRGHDRGAASPSREIAQPDEAVVAAGPVIGRITRLPAGKWRSAIPIAVGADVHAGQVFRLQQGVMELVYSSGVKVTLEGPTEYLAIGPGGGILLLGKLTVRTPKAAGRAPFWVRSESAMVTGGEGSEFGLKVDSSRATGIYVFRGAWNSVCRTRP